MKITRNLYCWLKTSDSHGLVAFEPIWLPENDEPEIDRGKYVRAPWLDLPFGESKEKYCCKFMKEQLNYNCEDNHGTKCPDVIIEKWGAEFSLIGRNAEYECNFCPSCGKKLEIDNDK